MSAKTKGSFDLVDAVLERIHGPGQVPPSSRGVPAIAGPTFKLPPLPIDAYDLAVVHQMALKSFDDAARTTSELERALEGARARQSHAWRFLDWIESELVAHHEKHGQPVTVKLRTIEQEPCIVCGAAGGHDEGCTVGEGA
jgi:hypothetical protein